MSAGAGMLAGAAEAVISAEARREKSLKPPARTASGPSAARALPVYSEKDAENRRIAVGKVLKQRDKEINMTASGRR